MFTLKLLSILLHYPDPEMLKALGQIRRAVGKDRFLGGAEKARLIGFVDSFKGPDLIEIQERYSTLFDQGKALSLHMFEHVHGESRERGQAMVDLLRMYESSGFVLAASELPDYIPLFLEFAAHQERHDAIMLLKDVLPVLNIIRTRLEERKSAYQAIFDALIALTGEVPEVSTAGQLDAPAAQTLDTQWADEPVTFGGCDPTACGSCPAVKARPQCPRPPASRGGNP
jgi:nitrate reductase delta subunit